MQPSSPLTIPSTPQVPLITPLPSTGLLSPYHQQSGDTTSYRPEINGLRAIAVLWVVLYHAQLHIAGIDLFQGGFLGVDIFFVISGYLITGILLREMACNCFTFTDFYERRVRRIIPALLTVMGISIPFAWIWMLPKQFQEYAESILASLLFGSNIFFWNSDSYHAEVSALKPFLHTWSLSVEEQYYVLFPIVLFLAWKFLRPTIGILMGLGLLTSLLLANWGSQRHPVAAFYLLPTRGWELFAGAWLANLEFKNGRRIPSALHDYLPGVGLALVLYSLLFLNAQVKHPSFWTVLPVAGTMLLIWSAGKRDIVSSLLASKPLVAIGVISYSLYLWHQPVLAFARIHTPTMLSFSDKVGLILMVFLLAITTWWLIETPFRNRLLIKTRTLWGSIVACTAILFGFGWYGFQSGGIPERFPENMQKLVRPQHTSWGTLAQDGEPCLGRSVASACQFINNPQHTTWMLVGDSHLEALGPTMLESVTLRHENLIDLTMEGACHYGRGIKVMAEGSDRQCSFAYNGQRSDFLLQHPPAILIIGGRLPLILRGEAFDNTEGGVEPYGNRRIHLENGLNNDFPHIKQVLVQNLNDLIQHGHKIILLYPIPEVGWDVPTTVYKKVQLSPTAQKLATFFQSGGVSTSYAVFQRRTQEAYSIYDALGEHPNVLRVYPEKLFCNTKALGRCLTHDEMQVFYADDDHPSKTGAKMIVDELMKAAKEKWNESI
ncbi:MAG: acyltransferase family protein [Nitrospirales bacterium]|nr:acyltransferase [Nitrospirales bacterium]